MLTSASLHSRFLEHTAPPQYTETRWASFAVHIGYTILYIISFLNCEFNPLMYQKFSCKSEFPIKLHIIQHAKLIFPYYAGKYIGVQYSSLNLLKISPLQDPLSNVYMYPVSYKIRRYSLLKLCGSYWLHHSLKEYSLRRVHVTTLAHSHVHTQSPDICNQQSNSSQFACSHDCIYA